MSLPSGSELRIGDLPFAECRALEKAIINEQRAIKFSNKEDTINIAKDAECAWLSSDAIDAALWKCMERCLYNGKKISQSTFEDVEARKDFHKVREEVANAALLPFERGNFAGLFPALARQGSYQE